MTTVLIVRAHVLDATRSHSMKGLDRFIEVYSATHPGDTIELLDVYDGSVPELDADLVAHLRPDGTEPSPEAQAKAARFDGLTDQFLAADIIGSGCSGFISLGILCKYQHTDSLAGSVRKNNSTADLLIGVTAVTAGPDMNFYCLIEFGCRVLLDDGDCLFRIILVVAIDCFCTF